MADYVAYVRNSHKYRSVAHDFSLTGGKYDADTMEVSTYLGEPKIVR